MSAIIHSLNCRQSSGRIRIVNVLKGEVMGAPFCEYEQNLAGISSCHHSQGTKICNSQGLTNQDTNLLYVTNLACKLSQNNRG